MKRNAQVYVDDILECLERIEEYVEGWDVDDFEGNFQLQDSVIRRLEIIGEAAKNMPEEIKQKHSKIPWKKIAGTRDVLIHAYFGIDLGMIWKVVKDDLPILKKEILKLKTELKK